MNNIGTKTIETERLILRKFKAEDVDSVFKNWAADEKVQSMYREPVYATKEAVKKLIEENYIADYEKKNSYRWAVISKENNECIGQIAFYLVDENNNFAEIEYCIGCEFQGRGYATEASKAVIKYGFEEMNLHKVQISHMDINNKSKRVIEKCGFKFEGICRDFFYNKNDDQYISRVYYSILRKEYEEMGRA